MHRLMCAPLRRNDDAADFLHLRVVRRTHAVQIAGDLKSGVTRIYCTYTCSENANLVCGILNKVFFKSWIQALKRENCVSVTNRDEKRHHHPATTQRILRC